MLQNQTGEIKQAYVVQHKLCTVHISILETECTGTAAILKLSIRAEIAVFYIIRCVKIQP